MILGDHGALQSPNDQLAATVARYDGCGQPSGSEESPPWTARSGPMRTFKPLGGDPQDVAPLFAECTPAAEWIGRDCMLYRITCR